MLRTIGCLPYQTILASEGIVYIDGRLHFVVGAPILRLVDKENMMIKFGLAAGAVGLLTLVFTVPVSAGDMQAADGHQSRKHLRAAPPAIVDGDVNLPIENALRWGYSQGYSNYPSGFGGLYGDGRYPGNTISNNSYNTLR
jgi:hypothetical protein